MSGASDEIREQTVSQWKLYCFSRLLCLSIATRTSFAIRVTLLAALDAMIWNNSTNLLRCCQRHLDTLVPAEAEVFHSAFSSPLILSCLWLSRSWQSSGESILRATSWVKILSFAGSNGRSVSTIPKLLLAMYQLRKATGEVFLSWSVLNATMNIVSISEISTGDASGGAFQATRVLTSRSCYLVMQ